MQTTTQAEFAMELPGNTAASMADRRRLMAEELDHYESKIRELSTLDPLDFTGLARTYRGHVDRIRALLAATNVSA